MSPGQILWWIVGATGFAIISLPAAMAVGRHLRRRQPPLYSSEFIDDDTP